MSRMEPPQRDESRLEDGWRERKPPPREVGSAPVVPDLRYTRKEEFVLDQDAASRLCFDRPYVKFAGGSQTHEDFQPPPADAFPKPGFCQAPLPLFAGAFTTCESQTHADFKAPPLPTLLPRPSAADRCNAGKLVGLAGQSRTHADFQPPTLADLKSFPVASPCAPWRPEIKFKGESTTHADYPAHPNDVFKNALAEQARTVNQAPGIPSVVVGGSRFEGESSAQRDYQAPPLEALRQMLESRDIKPSPGQTPIRFEGQSSMHADYQASPPATPFTPARLEGRRPESVIGGSYDMCATSIKESTSHHDYQAPPLEDLIVRAETAAQRRSDARTPPTRFEGQSTAHLDYIAPPANSFLAIARGPERPEETQELLRPDAPMLKQSTTHHDYQPPPLDQIKQVTCKEKSRESFERVCFEGESTTHADYPAHPIAEQARTVNQAPGIPSVVFGRKQI
eukprot:symbB.v1.2.037148.t1/scaffold5395.1/size27612/1